MLPDGFQWRYIGGGLGGDPLSLCCDGYEVARLWQRVDTGAWFATLGMHLPYEKQRHRPCTSQESGRDGCASWAQRHQDELREHVRQRRETWLATQTWRPRDDSPCDLPDPYPGRSGVGGG